MLTLLSTSPALTSLSLTLLHFMWQGLLVAVVLKSALLIFNNNKPQIRYALSTLAMLVNLLLPIITFAIIYQTENLPANALANSLVLSELIQELKQPDALINYQESIALLPSLLPYVAILWLATIFLLAGKLLLEIYNVNNLPQQNTVAPSQKLQTRFNELAKKIHLSITPQLLISLKVEVPMVIGWLKPVVLLPASMVSGLSTPQLEMLILHELAHIRRHDYLVNFFQTLVEVLLFFHPAVHWVSKQMRNEREYCSDDIAVQHCGDAVAYAHTLADTASLCTKAHHHTIPNMAMAASGGDLKQRVFRLVDHHCAPKNNISKWFASMAIIFSVLILSSKQLLTMPLLDIWYNDKPWLNSNNATNSQKNIGRVDKTTPNSSIANQLLKFQTSETNSKHTFDLEAQLESQQEITRTLTGIVIEVPLLIATKQQTIPYDTSPYSNQLNNFPLITSQSNNFSNELSTPIISTVEQTFEHIDSYGEPALAANPYHQKIEKLSISPIVKLTTTQPIKTIKSPNVVLVTDTPSLNSTKKIFLEADTTPKKSTRFVDHSSRQKNELIQPIMIVNKSILPLTPVWQSAEQVKKVVPIYPSAAERRGIEINVKVDFTIDVDGQIKNIKFAQHKRINYFKKSIQKAIEKWRFLPAKVNEKPVESQMAKVFSFSIQG